MSVSVCVCVCVCECVCVYGGCNDTKQVCECVKKRTLVGIYTNNIRVRFFRPTNNSRHIFVRRLNIF